MKLIDRLYNELKPRMGDLQVVFLRCQNIAEYYYEGTPQETWDFEKDFPSLAPPWPVFFATWRNPRMLNSEGRWIDHHAPGAEVVTVIEAMELAEGMRPLRWLLQIGIAWDFPIKTEGLHAELRGTAFLPVREDGSYKPLDDVPHLREPLGLILDRCMRQPGDPIRYRWPPDGDHPTSALLYRSDGEVIQNSGLCTLASISMTPVLLALSFISCRNVSMTPEEVPPALRKKRERLGKAPVEKWYTLQIEPMKKVLRAARDPNGQAVGLQNALHICRGHFKDYGEHGLFGRIKGTWWWSAQVRGTGARGRVVKDYETV